MLTRILMVLLLVGWMPVQAGEDEVVMAVDRFLHGASVGDTAIHDAFWAEELIYTSSNGTRFGKAELMSGMEGSTPTPEDEVAVWYRADDLDIQYEGPLALISFTLVAANVADESEAYFLNSGVLKIIDGRWQAIRWHATHKAQG